MHVQSGGATFTGTIAPIQFPTIGDKSAAYRLQLKITSTPGPLTLGYDFVLAYRGDTFMIVALTDVDQVSPPVLAQFATKALDKAA